LGPQFRLLPVPNFGVNTRDLRGWFHTFTSLPLVHTSNPDFWGNVFDLASCWFPNLLYTGIFTHCNLRIWTSLYSRTSQVRDSRSSRVRDSRSSQVRDFKASQVHDSRPSRIRNFKTSQVSTTLKWTTDSCEEARLGCHFHSLLEDLSREFRQTRRFESVRFFLNSPTLAPRGSGLTPTIRFRENFRILVKKSPSERRSRHASSRKPATVISRRFSWTTPLAPINRESSHHKKFSPLSRFSPNFCLHFRIKASRVKESEASRLPQFLKVLLSLFFCYHLLLFDFHIRNFCFAYFDSWMLT
jgi:hypothetical protein